MKNKSLLFIENFCRVIPPIYQLTLRLIEVEILFNQLPFAHKWQHLLEAYLGGGKGRGISSFKWPKVERH